MRTFDQLIHTALVDIATQAEPVDLVDAALDDVPRRTRVLALGAVATVTFTLTAGLVVGLAAGQDVPQGKFRPNRVIPGQPSSSSPNVCGTPGPAPGSNCANPEANATLAASESPSARPSVSASKRPTPDATSPTTTSTDGAPGNRPRPKPSKPGRAR